MKKKLLSKLLMMSFFMLLFPVPLQARADVTGVFAPDASVTGSILVNDANPEVVHIYKITLPEDGKLHFTLKPDGNLFPALTLLDADMKKARGSAGFERSTGQTDLTCGGLAAGAYYIKVDQGQPYNHETYSGSYTLSNTFEPIGGTPDALNDTKETASVAAPGTDIIGHIGYEYNNYRDTVDWYAVDMPEDGTLKLTLDASEDLQVGVQLLDGDKLIDRGNVFATRNPNDQKKEATFEGIGKGRYFLKVTLIEPYTSDYYYGLYTIDSVFTAAKYASDKEQNNDKASAINLGKATSGNITGHVGYSYNGVFDSEDWYKLTIAGTTLSLNFERTPAEGVAFLVADANGAEIMREDTTKTNKLLLTGLKPGVYHIVAWPLAVHQSIKYCASYSISYKAASSAASITKITPDPSVLTMAKGQKKAIKIKALMSGAAPTTITSQCSYKLADSKIAKIDKNGAVTAVAKGKTKVDVTYGKFKTSFTIIVK